MSPRFWGRLIPKGTFRSETRTFKAPLADRRNAHIQTVRFTVADDHGAGSHNAAMADRYSGKHRDRRADPRPGANADGLTPALARTALGCVDVMPRRDKPDVVRD